MLAMYEAEEVNKDCRMIAGLQVKKDKEALGCCLHSAEYNFECIPFRIIIRRA